MMKPLTLRVDDFCRLVGVGKTKTYELIGEGILETIKIGRRTLITMESVEALLETAKGGEFQVRGNASDIGGQPEERW